MLSLIISIVLFFMGLIVFIFGYISKYELVKDGYIEESNLSKVTKEKEELSLKVDEADKVLQELNKFSTYVSKELDTKHKELLFLYQMIDEKQESLAKKEKEVVKKTKKVTLDEKNEERSIKENKQKTEANEKEEHQFTTINDELKVKNILKGNQTIQEKIQALHNAGKSIDEIASTLRKGKNEIRLMIGMGKKE
ncbi:MAG TPA: hypothetical protein DEP72_09045 [Clostridiales bacterium]|nr:MAG: hypothetical protein A2Y18_05965 [Clostridiales bacterium GWD2_32_19]HCC08285.1 hypothetical protein [Clostridiales bacterium]